MNIKVIATNRKAKHDYFLLDIYEAGIVLKGTEIKSIRNGHVSIKEAYVRINDNEAWLVDSYIAPFEQAGQFNHEPKRPRKLLLHSSEIRNLWDDVRRKGVTIIPLKMYMKNDKAKVEIAIARGKKHYDKRAEIAKRDAEREMDRELRSR
jgi:SsrA-binding protein